LNINVIIATTKIIKIVEAKIVSYINWPKFYTNIDINGMATKNGIIAKIHIISEVTGDKNLCILVLEFLRYSKPPNKIITKINNIASNLDTNVIF